MEEQKHFHYEGSVEIKSKPKEVEILDVSFLTPARVTAKVDGCDVEVTVGVDLISRKIYDNNGESQLSEHIFEYLDKANSLPEDFFVASDDVRYQAEQAQQNHDLTKEKVSDVW
jgi:hypothetical protein